VLCAVSQICAFLFREGASLAAISVRWFLTGNNSSSVVLVTDLDLPLYLHVAERGTLLFTVEF